MDRQIAEVVAKTAALVAAAPARLGGLDAPPVVWRVPTSLPFVYDQPIAPRMVIVPAGEITIGAGRGESGRAKADASRRRIRIDRPFAVSMFPVTFSEYSLYAADSGVAATRACLMPGNAATEASHDWRRPGFAQTFRSPAVCISHADALAYVAWLSRLTGHRYRLLSDAEYEYAQRAGTSTAYWWGDDRAKRCDIASARTAVEGAACAEKAAFTAEVGAAKANAFGLFDITGNVASWTSDCWKSNDAKARGDCRYRAIRGGSWASTDMRSAARRKESVDTVSADLGFRVARDL